MENAIIIILAGTLIVREWQNWKDRRDLLDRIMSVDYREYKHYSKPPAAQRANVRMSDEEMAKAESEKNKC